MLRYTRILSPLQASIYCDPIVSCFISNILFTYFPCTCYFRFIIKKDAPGLTVTKIENKIGLRIVQNGDIVMRKVFVPDEDRIAGVNSFQDTNKVGPCVVFLCCSFNKSIWNQQNCFQFVVVDKNSITWWSSRYVIYQSWVGVSSVLILTTVLFYSRKL